MAQGKGSDQDTLGSPPPILDKLDDDDWGDDWEAAFQSEDLAADEEALAEEFSFTDDQEQAAEGTGPSPAAETGEPESDAAAGPGLVSRLTDILPAAATTLINLGRELPQLPLKLWRSFRAMGRPQKIVTGAIALTLLFSLLLFSTLSRAPGPQIVLPDDPFGLQEPLDAAPPAEPAVSVAEPEVPHPPPTEPDRHRISLTDFLIPVPGDTGHGDIFLQLDLTLTVQTPPGEPLNPVLKAQLRESIYNFYRRRDPADLRRYSLARGDMLRDLRFWLEEHHPELEADAISFDRYWLN
ncbi:hypothetical protein [Desulfurivibrio alkaliphilus]|uniref:Uncharacterized protein n=1 Tax=Desulfurivibrio alkaliphilus (strain DSM 19089 / UNIQEM U267 / AHT2) TaxID=589865 RepID=D6Z4E4_DESAT|nr:hypothetical protein [Desulfurivibrio alkaliphilus]ADH86419.1 hypothetical protein DaAHT2_1727 [Desulfurivibrio alkaliphilus AHT 2]